MRYVFSVLSVFMICLLLSSCNFIASVTDMSKATETFCETIVHEQYAETINMMEIDPALQSQVLHDTLTAQMRNLHDKIIASFGDKLSYKLIKGEKTFSTDKTESTPHGNTRIYLQIDNGESFGIITAVLNDESNKIVSFNLLNFKSAVPNMGMFWLFSILALLIPVFNIYVIIKVFRSNISKKWLRYLAIIIFNVPSISYFAVSGVQFHFLSFQILLGYSITFGGYLTTACTFGIPLGAIVVWWMINHSRREFDSTAGDSGNTIDHSPEM